VFDAKGAKAGEESGDIGRIGDGEGVVGAIMMEGETKKFRSGRVGFDVIEGRKTRHEKGEVRGVVVLDAEVVHYQDKGNGTRGVAEKTGGLGLVEIKRLQERDKAEIGKLTCLLEAVHRFFYAKNDVPLSRFVLLYKGKKREARQDFGEKKVNVDFNKLGLGEGRFKVKISKINRAKERVRRDNRVEENVDAREGSDESRRRDRRLETVASGGASHAPVDVRVVGAGGARKEKGGGGPFLFGHGVVISGGRGGEMNGAEGAGSVNELDELRVTCPQPLLPVGARHSGAEGEGRARGIEI
jgi:hypothetical protein